VVHRGRDHASECGDVRIDRRRLRRPSPIRTNG
jgi:hypothetical protein